MPLRRYHSRQLFETRTHECAVTRLLTHLQQFLVQRLGLRRVTSAKGNAAQTRESSSEDWHILHLPAIGQALLQQGLCCRVVSSMEGDLPQDTKNTRAGPAISQLTSNCQSLIQ